MTGRLPSAPKDYTKVNVQLLNEELQLGLNKRAQLLQMANVYKQAGMGEEYINAKLALEDQTVRVVNISQQKAINLFENNNDPRMLQAMWSKQSGRNITIVPRSDGNWNIMDGDKMIHENKTTGEIASPARMSASNEYAKGVRSARVAQDVAADTSRRDLKTKLLVKELESASALALENAKWSVTEVDGVMIYQRGGQIIKVNPDGVITTPDGRKISGITSDSISVQLGQPGSMTSIIDPYKNAVGS